ncbi:MAG TPA: serine--tRNA ligase [Candidatus Thermoplasmatota archaeon]|nr:serine--tRNA ligase [Candidatus Thermoplasmatota archaeon]
MQFDLSARIVLSAEAEAAKADLEAYFHEANASFLARNASGDGGAVRLVGIQGKEVAIELETTGRSRAHEQLLRLRKGIAERVGKKHKLGVRDLAIDGYEVTFDLERPAKTPFTIPFAKALKFDGTQVTMELEDTSEEFLQANSVDRMLNLVREKVEHQYYEGKTEMHHLLYASARRPEAWTKDPSEVMLEKEWLKQGPTKGKWFFRAQAAHVLRTMERIAIEEVLKPLGFEEVIIPHHVSLDTWIRTGHAHGVPNEIYYVVEPKTRDLAAWERYRDLMKITRRVPEDELMKNINAPVAGICYAQCENVYWSLGGKTVADASLPIKVFDATAVSNRYESGGRHGIERVDEFHRIEPVYIGTREHLLELRKQLLQRYMHVFNDVLELEWRVASVTPFYMSHSGMGDVASAEGEKRKEKTLDDAPETGTLDFEAWLPYRGSREESEWLEFQNLSIVGKKYTDAFNIKGQKADLWTGCSGIGLERWTVAFLAQKGLDFDKWPKAFQQRIGKMPKGVEFL